MLLIILLIIFFLLYITSSSKNEVKVECVKHTWIYKKQPGNEDIQYLQCEICNKFPGIDAEEGRV